MMDELNLSAELQLHAVEHLVKQRAADRVTPASGFIARTRPADLMFAARWRWKQTNCAQVANCLVLFPRNAWMAPEMQFLNCNDALDCLN